MSGRSFLSRSPTNPRMKAFHAEKLWFTSKVEKYGGQCLQSAQSFSRTTSLEKTEDFPKHTLASSDGLIWASSKRVVEPPHGYTDMLKFPRSGKLDARHNLCEHLRTKTSFQCCFHCLHHGLSLPERHWPGLIKRLISEIRYEATKVSIQSSLIQSRS